MYADAEGTNGADLYISSNDLRSIKRRLRVSGFPRAPTGQSSG